MIDWLRNYSDEKDEVYIRGFLGKMLFTGEETFKSVNVLSGGEKVRCMGFKKNDVGQVENLLMLDEPTNSFGFGIHSRHLNNGLKDFPGYCNFYFS